MYYLYYDPILQRGKLRHREVRPLAQGHTAAKGQGQDLNPGSLAPESTLPLKCPHYGQKWNCNSSGGTEGGGEGASFLLSGALEDRQRGVSGSSV